MKRTAIAIAVASAAFAAGSATASDTTSGVKFSHSWGEPTTRQVIGTVSDAEGNVTTTTRHAGQPDHASVKFWANTDWNLVQSFLTVELENFENYGHDYDRSVTRDAKGDVVKGGITTEDNGYNYANTNVNWQLRTDIEKLTGLDMSYGPLDKVYFAGKANWVSGYGERKRWWIGPTFVFDVPYTTGLELSVWHRDTLNVEGTAWHYIAAYNVPFHVFGQSMSFGQTYEWIEGGERADSHDWLETETGLTWNVAKDISLSALYNRNEDMEGPDGHDYHQLALGYKF